MAGKLILVRHGQSAWNLANLFTGWTDVDLTEQGRLEAARAGRELVRERLEDLVAAGANHLLLNPVSRHAEQLEAVAEVAGFK